MTDLLIYAFVFLSIGFALAALAFNRDRKAWMWEQFWNNLDKFLSIGLFLICLGVALYLIRAKADDGSITWIQGIAGQFMAGILALLGVAAKGLMTPRAGASQEVSKTVTEKTTVTPAPDAATSVIPAVSADPGAKTWPDK